MTYYTDRFLDSHAYERVGEFESISFDFVGLACEVAEHVGGKGDVFVEAHREGFSIIE